MKKRFLNLLYAAFAIGIVQLSSQPLPPSPEGGGNQGATIVGLLVFAVLLLCYGAFQKRKAH